jgi:hypothetical protein
MATPPTSSCAKVPTRPMPKGSAKTATRLTPTNMVWTSARRNATIRNPSMTKMMDGAKA